MTEYLPGAVVPLTFTVTDADGNPANAGAAALLITLPDGTTVAPTLDNPATGTYQADYTAAQSGRHTARATFTGANAGVIEDVFDVAPLTQGHVTITDVRAYLGETSATNETLAAVLLAEQFAQARRCRVDPFPPDLREALLRRVARNLAARAVPVTSFTSFDGGGTATRVPSTDPEIVRLEAPYRRLICG